MQLDGTFSYLVILRPETKQRGFKICKQNGIKCSKMKRPQTHRQTSHTDKHLLYQDLTYKINLDFFLDRGEKDFRIYSSFTYGTGTIVKEETSSFMIGE